MITKKQLAIKLSKLKVFEKPSAKLEQYPTNSEIAASILWFAYLQGDIENKVIADLGCGTGILGQGALLLDANMVYLLDTDKQALDIAQSQVGPKNAIFLNQDINEFDQEVDTVIQNPPFGTKIEHADKAFLEKAMQIADNIYTIHKTTTSDFVIAIAKTHGFEVAHIQEFKIPIKKTQKFHKKPVSYVDIACFHLKRNL
jgi:putative methylase